jgi:type IV pilus assembly protein PilA
MKTTRNRQAGFTQIEVMLVVVIIGVLGAIAIKEMRDYSRRAVLSEVVLAVNNCKNAISENYQFLEEAPVAGSWGCESATATTKHVSKVETSAEGVIRVAIDNVDGLLNGKFVYLVPMRADGETPMDVATDLGRSVRRWKCGSDSLPARRALPANCREDLTLFAVKDYASVPTP